MTLTPSKREKVAMGSATSDIKAAMTQNNAAYEQDAEDSQAGTNDVEGRKTDSTYVAGREADIEETSGEGAIRRDDDNGHVVTVQMSVYQLLKLQQAPQYFNPGRL